MNTTQRFLLLTVCGIALLFTANPSFADSKYIANYYLATPDKFEGKNVKLDISKLQPAHFQSPSPELMFYRADTRDNWTHRHGGSILVAVLKSDSEKFAKKYGVVRQNDTTSLNGTFLSMPNRVPFGKGMARQYFVDTTGGKALSLLGNKPSDATATLTP